MTHIRYWQFPQPVGVPGVRNTRAIIPPASIPRPFTIKRCALANQAQSPAGLISGAWFLAVDPGGVFARTSRWPLTESGPIGRLKLLAVMDPARVSSVDRDQAVEIVFNEGDQLIVDSTFEGSTGSVAWMWALIACECAGDETILETQAGNDGNTKLLCNMENAEGKDYVANAAVGFTGDFDARSAVLQGHPFLDAAQAWSGDTALWLDGTSSAQFPSNSAYSLASGNWTSEVAVRPANTDSGFFPILATGSSYCPCLISQTGSQAVFHASSNGSSWNVASGLSMGSLAANTWTHLAAVRNGSTITLYRDGCVVNTVSISGNLINTTGPVCIGKQFPEQPAGFMGHVDDVRISNVARWTSAFTPVRALYTA